MILNELIAFLEAESPLTIFEDTEEQEQEHQQVFFPTQRLKLGSSTTLNLSMISNPVPVPAAAELSSPTTERNSTSSSSSVPKVQQLSLQEILIIGSKLDQVKFSELTIDMFRMLQTFEREPSCISAAVGASPGSAQLHSAAGTSRRNTITENGGSAGSGSEEHLSTNNQNGSSANDQQQEPVQCQSQSQSQQRQQPQQNQPQEKPNPHKHLLYRPTLEQLLVFLSSSSKWLGTDGVLLVYVSGDAAAQGLYSSSGQSSFTPSDIVSPSADTNPFRPKPIAVTPAVQPTCAGTGILFESGGIVMNSTMPIIPLKKEPSSTMATQGSTSQAAGSLPAEECRASVASRAKQQRKDKQW